MSPTAQSIAALWLAADQRKDAGEPPSVPSDDSTSARAWLTDHELYRLKDLSAVFSLELATDHAGASDRLAARIAARRAEK